MIPPHTFARVNATILKRPPFLFLLTFPKKRHSLCFFLTILIPSICSQQTAPTVCKSFFDCIGTIFLVMGEEGGLPFPLAYWDAAGMAGYGTGCIFFHAAQEDVTVDERGRIGLPTWGIYTGVLHKSVFLLEGKHVLSGTFKTKSNLYNPLVHKGPFLGYFYLSPNV